jgi:ABC-type glycerol-3-phosphate transport system permease component
MRVLSWTKQYNAIHISSYFILITFSFFALIPVYWGLVTSLKEPTAVLAFPPQWVSFEIYYNNYTSVFQHSNIPRQLFNSFFVSIFSIVIILGVSCPAAYAAARFDFPGKNSILFIILCTIMIPGISILIPLYLMISRIGIHDTYFAVTLVHSAWRTPLVIWFLKGFFESIPSELDESAMIDGCTRFQAFYKIVLPLTRPGLASASILVFVYVWNDFLITLTMSSSDNMRLIQAGLYNFITTIGIEWGRLMAALILALLPILVIFFLLQKSLIQGLTSGARKG